MQDRFQNNLAVGDEVAYSESDRSTRLAVGVIERFTAKLVYVRNEHGVTRHSPDRLVKFIQEK